MTRQGSLVIVEHETKVTDVGVGTVFGCQVDSE